VAESAGAADGAAAADPRKSVTVPVAAAEAFRIYTEYPAEWLPAEHTFIPDPRSIAMEPRAGGRFYERSADGTEVTRGTIVEWAPPHRLAVTWRIGPGWRPVFDDEHASVIVVEFIPAGPDATEVTLTYTHLDRHGEIDHRRGVTRVPGLYVLGLRFLHRRNSSFVDGVGPDARFVAAHLTRRTPPAVP